MWVLSFLDLSILISCKTMYHFINYHDLRFKISTNWICKSEFLILLLSVKHCRSTSALNLGWREINVADHLKTLVLIFLLFIVLVSERETMDYKYKMVYLQSYFPTIHWILCRCLINNSEFIGRKFLFINLVQGLCD